jgi:hypothetical protein
MIKFVIAAIWLCVATAGAAIYSFQNAGAKDEAEAKPLLGGLDYVNTDMISVPLIRNASIQGYFLTRLVYTVDPADLAKLSVPPSALMTDQVYSYLYANPEIDFTRTDTLDLDAFRKNIRDTINARIGVDLVKDVLVDQVNYLSKDEIRDNALRRRQNPGGTVEEAAKPAAEH